MSIDGKFSVFSDFKSIKDQLVEQEKHYDNTIAAINDAVTNEATKKADAKNTFLNFCKSSKIRIESVQADNPGEFTAEEAEVAKVIEDYQAKIDSLE